MKSQSNFCNNNRPGKKGNHQQKAKVKVSIAMINCTGWDKPGKEERNIIQRRRNSMKSDDSDDNYENSAELVSIVSSFMFFFLA